MNTELYPEECRGCYASCYSCTKTKNGAPLRQSFELTTKKIMKLQAISRLERELAAINKQLEELGI